MVFSKYEDIKITAIAAAVPEHVITIADMLNDPSEDPKFIRQFMKNTGIREKRMREYPQTAGDFSCAAARQIMDAGYYRPEEIGVLINITQTPDYRSPSTAMVIQKRLGISKDCIVFDINLGCSGFVYGISLAASILKTSTAEKAIVTVGDTQARGRLNQGNKKRTSNTRLLMGDASAAILLERGNGNSFSSALMSDGTGYKALIHPYGAWRHPVGPENVPEDDIAVFNFTIREVPALLNEYLKKTDTVMEEYDALVLHQANLMIVKNIAKRVGMPMEKVPICLDRFGNTSGSSVPLTIADKYGEMNDDREISFLTSSFGIGLSWGVAGFRINVKDILPITEGAEIFSDGYSDAVMNDEE